MTSDAAHIRLLTTPGAHLVMSLEADTKGHMDLLLRGNRAGVLSLANVLLWLHATVSRREFLSLGELPFIETLRGVALHIRVGSDDATGQHGVVRKLDRGHEFEWTIQQDDLQAVGLSVHHLAMTPEHEYTLLETEARSVARIQIRMSDVNEWL